MRSWRFSIAGEAWRAAIPAVPTEETKRAFWQQAVPELALQRGPPPPRPCAVVCRLSARTGGRSAPGGPLGRAKGLLDALHDDRLSGPRYRDLPGRAPLVDDHPSHVRALAVEVAAGEPHTEYLLGAELAIAGELIASVPVEAPAPNDIVGTPEEKAKIATGRAAFAAAVQRAFAHPPACSTADLRRSSFDTGHSATRTTPGRLGSPQSAEQVAKARATGRTALRSRAGFPRL